MIDTVQLKFHISRIVALQTICPVIMDVCLPDHVSGRMWTTALNVMCPVVVQTTRN